MDPGEDLDERALAGAVLADERVDLAGTQVERHVVERLGRPEPLRHAGERDGARRGRPTGSASRHRSSSRRRVAQGAVVARPRRDGPRPHGTAGPRTVTGRRGVVGDDRGQIVHAAERRERRPPPLRAVDDADDLSRGVDHGALDLGLFLGRVAQTRLEAEAGRSQERLLDVDLAEQPVAQRSDDRQGLPSHEAAWHHDGDPRDPGQLLRRSAGRS